MARILDEGCTDAEIASAYREGKAVYEREGITEADLVASMSISKAGGYLPLVRRPKTPAAASA